MIIDTKDLFDIIFWWNILAWMAVGIRCELSDSPVLTLCQMFWIMLLWPPVMAVIGTIAWCIGIILPDANWGGFWQGVGTIVGVIGVFVVFVVLCIFFVETSKKCPIIWRRKSKW